MESKKLKFRNPEDLTDSSEEIHPNIDSKSYHKCIKEQRKNRIEELLSKKFRNSEEEKELEILQNKEKPIAVLNSTSFRTIEEDSDASYTQEFSELFNCQTKEEYLLFFDRNKASLDSLEDLIYFNILNYLKEEDENSNLPFEFTRMILMIKWAKEGGRAYLNKILDSPGKIDEAAKEQLEDYKLALQKSD